MCSVCFVPFFTAVVIVFRDFIMLGYFSPAWIYNLFYTILFRTISFSPFSFLTHCLLSSSLSSFLPLSQPSFISIVCYSSSPVTLLTLVTSFSSLIGQTSSVRGPWLAEEAIRHGFHSRLPFLFSFLLFFISCFLLARENEAPLSAALWRYQILASEKGISTSPFAFSCWSRKEGVCGVVSERLGLSPLS